MLTVKVIHGLNGDMNLVSMIYELSRSFKEKIGIDEEVDLLYDHQYPTLEVNGRRVVFDFLTEEEARAKLSKLIKGEVVDSRGDFRFLLTSNNSFADGVSVY
ncbi:MAG: hypothetical protein MPF33_03315 [Candidatus Aramenus sp.]|jgi:hypothetical protein|nr:hypothetical protein [Candidatus Aramenus sp.]